MAIMDPSFDNIKSLNQFSGQDDSKKVRQEIVNTLHKIKKINHYKVKVYLYQGTPRWRIFSIDGDLWVQHYISRNDQDLPTSPFKVEI